eukprot:scaffold21341_cov88-Isochrysis_galbana.AAC.3
MPEQRRRHRLQRVEGGQHAAQVPVGRAEHRKFRRSVCLHFEGDELSAFLGTPWYSCGCPSGGRVLGWWNMGWRQ